MTEAVAQSRILTLVFTDLADSTALKTQHGDQRVGELIARHRALVSTLASAAGGRVIDWAGDGCFLTFETPSAAVAFALRLQQVHSEEPDLPGVRTGIHMGEVSERTDGDGAPARVEGLAVDLAARICGLARPAQVLMSSAVADSARQRLDAHAFTRPIAWRSHGRYLLKGFDKALDISEAGLEGVAPLETPGASDKGSPARPTRGRLLWVGAGSAIVLAVAVGYFASSSTKGRPSPGRTQAAAPTPEAEKLTVPGFGDRPAIAVLPFDNLSGDPEQEYFADGLAEDLITRLSLWRSFPVIARNSSFVYKGKAVDLTDVSADLGVRYVVEGSVRKAGSRVRIVAQLIDATRGEHVWAQTYDRELTDVFAVQDEISSAIAASLVGDLQRAEQARAERRAPESLEAWALYQRAIPIMYRFTREDSAEARALLDRSISLDPGFAPAHARLAEALIWEVAFGFTDAPKSALGAALAEARRAADLDPREPSSHMSLAFALAYDGQIDEAVAESQKATELNPSEPIAAQYSAYLLAMAGHPPEQSIALIERAMRLSPHDPLEFLFYDGFGVAYFCAGRFADGVAASRELVALRPTYVLGYIYGAMSAAELGEIEEAREFVRQAREVQPDLSFESAHRALGGMAPDVDRRMSAALRKAGLE